MLRFSSILCILIWVNFCQSIDTTPPNNNNNINISRNSPYLFLHAHKNGSNDFYAPEKDEHFPNNRNQTKPVELPNVFSLPENIKTCSLCMMREHVKEQNIVSLKFHILKRLEMQQPPNITITSRPHISEKVIHSFYAKYGHRYIRLNDTNKNLLKVTRDGGGEHSNDQSMQHLVSRPYPDHEDHDGGEMDYYDEFDYGHFEPEQLQYGNEFDSESEFDETEDDVYSKVKKLYYFPKSKKEITLNYHINIYNNFLIFQFFCEFGMRLKKIILHE